MDLKPSKRQLWWAVTLMMASNFAIIAIQRLASPGDWRTLVALGICLLSLVAGAVWLLAATFRRRKSLHSRRSAALPLDALEHEADSAKVQEWLRFQ